MSDEIVLDSSHLVVPNRFHEKKNYDSAAHYYNLAADRYLDVEKYPEYFVAISNMAIQYLILGDNNKAIDILNQAEPYLEHINNAELILSKFYYGMGLSYYYLNQADSSEKYLLKTLQLQENILSKPSLDKALTYINLGKLYSYLFLNIGQGQNYYGRALNEMHGLSDSTQQNTLFNIYYSMANNSRQRKNLDKAEYYALRALEIGENLTHLYYQEYGHNLLASIFYAQEKHEKSIREYELLIELENKSHSTPYLLVVGNFNLGLLYAAIERYEESIGHLQKALLTLNEHNFEKKEFECEMLAYLGKSYYLNKNEKQGELHFKKSLNLANENNIGQEMAFALIHEIMGDSYMISNEYQKALTHFSRSFNIVRDNFPGYSYKLFKSLRNISQIQLELGKQTDDIKLLWQSFDNFIKADSIIQELRRTNYLDSDEIWLNNRNQKFYEDALECIGLLYQVQPQKNLIQAALKFIEQNKSRVLSKSLKNAELLQSVGVTNDLIQQWSDLKYQIAEWQSKAEKNEDQFAQKRLVQLNEQLELVNYKLENEYKSYAELRIKPIVVDYDSILNIAKSDSTAIISYFNGAKHLISLTIRPDSSFINFISLDSTYYNNLVKFRKVLENPDPTSPKQFRQFKSLSHYLFRALIEPSITANKSNSKFTNIIIIPDKDLAFIPFEVLIQDTLQSPEIDYKRLPYLIKSYPIHYQNSHHFLQKSTPSSHKKSELSFGGWGYQKLPDNDYKLPNTRKELNNIARDFQSKIYFDKQATESNFKKYSGAYDILHMSIHGSANSDSLKPSLLFYPDEDNDGKVFPYELFNLNLKAELAVLSACETGLGKIEPGEGVQHISRGFFYSGCSNVMMSLWQINDLSTFKIQERFYHNLKSGQPLENSLSNSKLRYIDDADRFTSHPSYWSSMILVGSAAAIVKEDSWNLLTKVTVILSLSVLTVIFVLLVRSRYYTHPHTKS